MAGRLDKPARKKPRKPKLQTILEWWANLTQETEMSDTPRTFAVAGRARPHILALCDALERENAALMDVHRRALAALERNEPFEAHHILRGTAHTHYYLRDSEGKETCACGAERAVCNACDDKGWARIAGCPGCGKQLPPSQW